MAEARYLPHHFVDYLTSPGLHATAGPVALDQYMCKTNTNGGNDSATSLFQKLRWMKDGGHGSTMNSLVGGRLVDQALKGQGQGTTFVEIWNFMCRNKEQLKTLSVEVCGRRERKASDKKVVLKTGNVFDLYFKGRSEKAALQAMVADRFFGIDCIGFAAGFLLYNHEWNEYKGATPSQWPMWHCRQKVGRAADVKPLDFLLWDGHIALVDWVWGTIGGSTVEIDVCQSSAGGPQCNEHVRLQETNAFAPGSRRLFRISHLGSPAMPVTGNVFIMRRAGFFW
jgi:hypothetical protein